MKLSAVARSDSKESAYAFDSFRLEPDGSFFRGQTQIHLPPKELAALRLLVASAGQIVTPAQLKQALWGDVHVTSDSVPRCLSSLRARLEPDQCIQTIYKRGYRLMGPVRRLGSGALTQPRLAIMPFSVGHNVEEHLGPAIAEEVTARLTSASPSRIAVVARDSVFALARRGMTAVQVAEALNADLVLAATLHALPTHYRLRAEMIRVEDGTQIWVEDMLVAHDQLSALQSELVQRLVFRLGGEFSIALNRPATPPDLRPGAYEAFLRGHQEWQSHERHHMQDGMQHLIQATELDPSLVAAQVDLAHVCITQEFYGFLSPAVAAQQVRRIADSISNVAGTAPALLPALGWIRFHVDHDLAAAAQMFSASGHLPHDPWITRLRAMFALSRHRFDEAVAWLRSALLVDPHAPWLHARLAWAYHLAGEAALSVEQIEKSLFLFPDHESGHLYGAILLAFNGHAQRAAGLARELVRKTPQFDAAASVYAYALAAAGERGQAQEILERLQWLSRERFVLRSFNCAAYVALGNLDDAIAELRAADDARCPWFFEMLADPRLAPLQNRPEFQALRATLEQMERSIADPIEDLF